LESEVEVKIFMILVASKISTEESVGVHRSLSFERVTDPA
jgi:hypothetical protein